MQSIVCTVSLCMYLLTCLLAASLILCMAEVTSRLEWGLGNSKRRARGRITNWFRVIWNCVQGPVARAGCHQATECARAEPSTARSIQEWSCGLTVCVEPVMLLMTRFCLAFVEHLTNWPCSIFGVELTFFVLRPFSMVQKDNRCVVMLLLSVQNGIPDSICLTLNSRDGVLEDCPRPRGQSSRTKNRGLGLGHDALTSRVWPRSVAF